MSFDFPGAVNTYALGINNAGQIVGAYDYNTLDHAQHGFVTSPIAPADFEKPGCCVADPNWKE
jgi:probable HAF family extracellular repeat protein